jgi:hypothetical protein
MKRRLFNLAAAVSLVMMLALVVLWVRSYWACDLWATRSATTYSNLESWRGALVIAHIASRRSVSFSPPYFYRLGPFAFGRALVNFTETRHSREPLSTRGPAADAVVVAFPYWLPVAALLALPAAWIWTFVPKGAHGKGLCPRCGYDLRATPDRCPECGTSVAAKPAEAAA